MRTLKAALLPALLCTALPATAASPDELASLREQLAGLSQRLDVLEQENRQLASENERLRNPVPAAAPVPTKDESWTERVKVNADLRLRHDQIMPETGSERIQHRARARLGFAFEANDAVQFGVQLATGVDNPRSANQTFGGVQSRKSIGLDLAWADWQIADSATLSAGKMKYPFVRVGQSLFFDSDPNPEGFALSLRHDEWFGSLFSFWLDERLEDDDALLAGGQFGWKGMLGRSRLLAAVQYYDLGHVEGRRPFYGCSGSTALVNNSITCAYGNTVTGTNSANAVLAYDFRIAGAMAEFTTPLAGRPLQLWIDYARNLAPDALNDAYALGVTWGKATQAQPWDFGLAWQRTGKDALFGQFIDGEFADGRTDVRGWVARANYAAGRNVLLGATWMQSELNLDVGVPTDYERLFLDVIVKF